MRKLRAVQIDDPRRPKGFPRQGAWMGSLTAQHPNRSDELLLRAGTDRNGVFVYYEMRVPNYRHLASRILYRSASAAEVGNIENVLATGAVVEEHLPEGGSLFFVEFETMGNLRVAT